MRRFVHSLKVGAVPLFVAILGCKARPDATKPPPTSVPATATAAAVTGAPAASSAATAASPAPEDDYWCAKGPALGWSPSSDEVRAALAKLRGICFHTLGARDYCGTNPPSSVVQEAVSKCAAARGSSVVRVDIKLDPSNPACAPSCLLTIGAVAWGTRHFIAVQQEVPGWIPPVWVTDTFEIQNGLASPYFRGTPSDCVVPGHGEDGRQLFSPLKSKAVLSDTFRRDLRASPPWDVARILCGYPANE
jgi:hypothetical protein